MPTSPASTSATPRPGPADVPVPVPEGAERTPVLDEAFDRLAASGFELPNGFVNHAAMACEALAALGRTEDIDAWARRLARVPGAVVPVRPERGFDPGEAMGRYDRLPEWVGYFAGAIEDAGPRAVIGTWVPRLAPALSTALFHGAIRTAHAARAVAAADTPARRAELARALGYWAARFRPGREAGPLPDVEDVGGAILDAAADGAGAYLARPGILPLHGVTGAMAAELLVDHLSEPDGRQLLAQLRAEHAALYAGIARVDRPAVAGVAHADLAEAAARSRDPHQVKLVEACRRGTAATGDPVFAAAAETVTSPG